MNQVITPLERAMADRQEYDRRMGIPDFAHFHVQEVRHSYKLMIEMASLRDGRFRRTPVKGVGFRGWPREIKVLEVGYGMGYGLAHLRGPKMNVPEENIMGFEIDPDWHARAEKTYPKARFYLMKDEAGYMSSTMQSWATAGVSVNMVVARMVMDHIDDVDAVLRGASALLIPSGIYVQTTACEVGVRRDRTKDAWMERLKRNGLNPYFVGWWKHRTIDGGTELYAFCRKGEAQ